MKKLILPLLAFILSITMVAQEQVPSATFGTAGKLTVKWQILTSPGTDTYLAVYITNSSNQLVNTLSYQYGSAEAAQLTTFYSLIGSKYSTASFKFVGSPDGTTGATFTGTIAQKTVYWGNSATMAASVAALADGNYNVAFEIVRRNNLRNYYTVTFAKGPATSTPTIPAMSYFSGVTVSWVPANTAVQNVELQKLYSLYPTQAVSSIYVSGSDIEGMDICSLNGKILLHGNEQQMNISQLPKGAYLAVVYTKSGNMVVKKFQKI